MTAHAQVLNGRNDVARRAEASQAKAKRPAEPVSPIAVKPREAPYSLREMLDNPQILIPPKALIPHLAWPGRATLISGREKSGKSTLVGQGVAASTRGGEFLGEQLQPAVTLWYGIDEDIGDTVRRVSAFNADPDALFIQPERPSASQMEAEIRDTGADIVVIDVLPELYSGLITSARSSDDILPFLRPYVNVARDTGIALVFLHHTVKNGVEYRDSTAIGGVVDVVLTLRQRGIRTEADGEEWDAGTADDGRRLLDGKGRGGINVKLRLAFDGVSYSVGSAPMPPRARILSELSRGEASGSTLASALKVQKGTVLTELRDLHSDGLVVKRGTGPKTVYEISASGSQSILSVPDQKPHTQTPEPIELDEVEI